MAKFLALQHQAFGLDISDLSIKAASLKKRGRFFDVLSFNEVAIDAGIIDKGVIQNEDAVVKNIKEVMKIAGGKKITTKYVIASLPEERSFLQVIQMPLMKEEELKSAVAFEAESYIPLPMSEVYLDYQVISPGKKPLDHLDVLIVAMPKKIINAYVACLKKAGLVPLAFEVESEAIARALVKNETATAPLVLVDFGKTSTVFIIFSQTSIQFTCSIPISSSQLTEAIAASMAISPDKAEKLKIKCDISKSKQDPVSEEVMAAMQPILEDFSAQMKKYINFYQDHTAHEHGTGNEMIEKVLLCGGGSSLKGLPEYFSEKLGIPVQMGDIFANMPVTARQRKRDFGDKNFLTFATSLGLALRGINTNKNITT